MSLKKTRIALIAGISLLGSAAIANQILGFYPLVGGASYCASTVNASCVQTIPAGPIAVTGNETILAETNLPNGQMPQGVLIQTGMLNAGAIGGGSYASPKNLFRNGDISVNPFQAGTSQAADITNTVTTAADGFRMVGGASSAINWSQQTGATDIVANQFTASLRFQRKSSNANTAQVCQISVLTSGESVPLQGQKFVYSFWAKAGANFSPTNSNIIVKVASGTSSSDTSANFKAGSWSGYADDITAANSGATVASGVATIPTSTTWTQYYVSGLIPATATQVGTEICFTPVGTAGTNDWIETSNHQLEIVGGSVVAPTAFEHHTPAKDLLEAQRYLYVIAEGALGPSRSVCHFTTANTAMQCPVLFPVNMRVAPTVTYATGFAGFTTTAETTANACTGNATSSTVALASSTSQVLMTCTIASGTTAAVGISMDLIDNGGTGKITASAEL